MERILQNRMVFLSVVINTRTLWIVIRFFSLKIFGYCTDRGRNCMYTSIGKCSMVSLSIHCNVKSEFANPVPFTISFRYDEHDIIRILILAYDIHVCTKVCAHVHVSNAFIESARLRGWIGYFEAWFQFAIIS